MKPFLIVRFDVKYPSHAQPLIYLNIFDHYQLTWSDQKISNTPNYYLFDEFEALVDDKFEDAIEEYVDLDEDPEKETSYLHLSQSIARGVQGL